MTQNQHSLLNPVGKAQSILVGTKTMTMVLCEPSVVPEGTELFVQPSEGRLKLEVEVANDNAQKWKACHQSQLEANSVILKKLSVARTLLRRAASFTLNPDLQRDIDALLRE